ncbi:MAG: DUF5678 domain-containing protein [Patescibacteria group bacterium]|mgnify:CR=1 FL=1
MKRKSIDINEFAKYEDQYVALSQDSTKIVASGKTIKDLHKKLEKIKAKDVIIDYIFPLNASLSPVCQ